ncbi:MAG: sugar transferase [Anaerolineales bacterium]|nr:sugar transferase [Anaerolineales bacterium]
MTTPKTPRIPIAKRIFDYLLILVFSPILLPLLALTSLIVAISLGRPVIFRQERAGYQGKPFTLYKFRSMSDARDKHGNLLSDEKRLTRFGRFLRSSSLDELPELWNVLKGEMSLVGPRPLLVSYLERYNPEQARRHDVLPGISGWAQINGRNNVSWEIKFELDLWYVDNWSLWLDLLILLKTAAKVITREGINQPGNATAQEFTGTPKD